MKPTLNQYQEQPPYEDASEQIAALAAVFQTRKYHTNSPAQIISPKEQKEIAKLKREFERLEKAHLEHLQNRTSSSSEVPGEMYPGHHQKN